MTLLKLSDRLQPEVQAMCLRYFQALFQPENVLTEPKCRYTYFEALTNTLHFPHHHFHKCVLSLCQMAREAGTGEVKGFSWWAALILEDQLISQSQPTSMLTSYVFCHISSWSDVTCREMNPSP